MKKLTMAVLVLFTLAVVSSAQAQDKRGGKHAEKIEQRFEHLSTKLNLRPDQKEKVKAVLKEHMVAIRDIRKNPDHNAESRKTATKAEMKKADEKINALLDDAQREAYKKHKEEKRAELKKKAEERRKEKEELEDEGIF